VLKVSVRLAALSGWRRLAFAALCGVASACSLPPFYVVPLLLAFAALVWLLDGAASWRAAFGIAWVFAFGQFVVGLHWTGLAFLVDAARFAVLLPFPIVGLPAVLAIIPGLAIAALWALHLSGAARVLGLALAWTLAEYARGHLFTGFPWNLVGYVWVAADAAMQSAAVIGVYGLTLLTVAGAASFALLDRAQGWRWPAGFTALVVAMVAIGAWRLPGGPTDSVAGVRLRLVQAAVDQYEKWQEDKRAQHVAEHLDLTLSPAAHPITHVVWPESAIPLFIELDPAGLAYLARAVPPGGLFISGVPRRTPLNAPDFRAWNGLIALDERGQVRAGYNKVHLVPFGEYLPLRPWLGLIGIDKLVPSAVDYSPGDSTAPVDLPGLPPARALVCYEAIFPGEVGGGARAGWLLNVTNDGWFGRSIGPHQHLAMARMRAVEQGLPLVRAANTGISAIVDAYGRTIASLGLGERGVVDGPLPVAVAPPPYALFGDLAVLPVVAAFLAFCARRRRRR
jgi:apolipoprotein N-acyltransferase